MSAPEEPMEQRPDPGWKVLLYDPVGQRWSDDWDGALHPTREDAEREAVEANESPNLGLVYDDAIVRQWAHVFRLVPADIVEAHQRLLDAIGDPGLVRSTALDIRMAMKGGDPIFVDGQVEHLRRIADAVGGGS